MLDYIPAGKLHDGQPEIIRKKKTSAGFKCRTSVVFFRSSVLGLP